MKFLFDADLILEFILNRSNFVDIVEGLLEIFEAEPTIYPHLSQIGLNKIVTIVEAEKADDFYRELRNIFTILVVDEAVLEKARSSSAIDPESAIEVALAIEANIKAIVTCKPNDFSQELKLISLGGLKDIQILEKNYLKDTHDLSAVFVINLEKALHLPSYTGVKSLEQNKSSYKVEVTHSSDKVSSPSADRLSPQSTNARSLGQIMADSLYHRPTLARSTAQVDILKYDELVTACRAYKSPLDIVKESIHGVNASVVRISDIQSSLVDRLSIKPSLTQLIAHPDTARFGKLAASIQVGNSSPIDRLLPESIVAISAGKIDFLKSAIPTNAIKLSKNPFDDLIKGALQDGKAHSSLIDRLSIKPILARSIAQLEAARLSGLATDRLTYKSSLDSLKESINRYGQDNYFSDRYGLLPQFKLLESMQRANTLESYLSRKN